MRIVTQPWVNELSFMQQSVLLSAIRGPDGVAKGHRCKPLLRWFRRCILISAFDGVALDNPAIPGGGSFTGPSYDARVLVASKGEIELRTDDWRARMVPIEDAFMASRDELPYHYQTHMMHAVQIVGYKHDNVVIRDWWSTLYRRIAEAQHLWPETEAQMDSRLSDDADAWRARSDRSECCSD